jgi:uncharacterized repeat protein (TIGR04076 family)
VRRREAVPSLPRCKITVLKRPVHQDLIDEYLDEAYRSIGFCERFEDDQEFVVRPDEGFCAWAWADIRHDVLAVAYGGNMPGMRRPGTAITDCTDWCRFVTFRVERMD